MGFESKAGRMHTGVPVEPTGLAHGIRREVRELRSDHNQLPAGPEAYGIRRAAGVSDKDIPGEPTGGRQGRPERPGLLRSIEAKGNPGGQRAGQPSHEDLSVSGGDPGLSDVMPRAARERVDPPREGVSEGPDPLREMPDDSTRREAPHVTVPSSLRELPVLEHSARHEENTGFNFTKLVEVTDSEVEYARLGIVTVLNRYLADPTDVTLVFTDRIIGNRTGVDEGTKANYSHDTRTYSFAMDHIRAIQSGKNSEAWTLFFAAHEAMHQVRNSLGEDIPTDGDELITTGTWGENPHEIEGNLEATHVMKHVFPNAQGTITIGHRPYAIPERSKYSTL